jgi:6-phosphogluconolactonase
MTPVLRVLKDPEELARAAAGEFTRLAVEAARARGRFVVALSGGGTPRGAYTLLAATAGPGAVFRARVPWDRVHVFWGDERHLPAGHPDRNETMARATLLSRVPIPEAQVHPVPPAPLEAAAAAEAYDRALREFFALKEGHWPRFDLMLLGLGADGHVASLFPGSPALSETSRLAAAVSAPAAGDPASRAASAPRVALTPPVFSHAAAVLLLVGGAVKAEALRAALSDEGPMEAFPARMVRPRRGALTVLADREAVRLVEL